MVVRARAHFTPASTLEPCEFQLGGRDGILNDAPTVGVPPCFEGFGEHCGGHDGRLVRESANMVDAAQHSLRGARSKILFE
jgi:hypothetical protein